MIDLKEARHQLSKEFDIAAEDLDESVIPILIGISKASKTLQIQTNLIEQLLLKTKSPIYCDKPKTALLVGIGKFGSISLSVSLFLSVFWIGIVYFRTYNMKTQSLEYLSNFVTYNPQTNQYFIKKGNYYKVKTGIILKK
ncbi:hypothetical protein VB796_21465 [Arcicella sp. LKC2W]|uniref:hypothetical protein n=1 Tax=Arcicella sp. LKC2W TaxID=2984198 RepID=UPI002B2155D6|nr:hypothetical protein [Arcicella sp. LKC2W]MEA5461651.1 hypothetical protein [Arcicella sp. LKC2W]